MGGTGNWALNEATAGGSGAAAGGSSSGGTYSSVGVDGSPDAPHPLREETHSSRASHLPQNRLPRGAGIRKLVCSRRSRAGGRSECEAPTHSTRANTDGSRAAAARATTRNFQQQTKKMCKENCSAKLHVNTNINSKLETHLDWRSARLWRRRSFDVRAARADWAQRSGRRGQAAAPPLHAGVFKHTHNHGVGRAASVSYACQEKHAITRLLPA